MFLSFRDAVTATLTDALSAIGYEVDDLAIEEPPGDMDAVLATSVAFRLASEAGAPPPEIVMASRHTIANALSAIGIAAPESM